MIGLKAIDCLVRRLNDLMAPGLNVAHADLVQNVKATPRTAMASQTRTSSWTAPSS